MSHKISAVFDPDPPPHPPRGGRSDLAFGAFDLNPFSSLSAHIYVRICLSSIHHSPHRLHSLRLPLLPPLFLPVLLSFLCSFLTPFFASFPPFSPSCLSYSSLSFSPSILCFPQTFFTLYVCYSLPSLLPSVLFYFPFLFFTSFIPLCISLFHYFTLSFFPAPVYCFVSPSVLPYVLLSFPSLLSVPPSLLPSFQDLG